VENKSIHIAGIFYLAISTATMTTGMVAGKYSFGHYVPVTSRFSINSSSMFIIIIPPS